MMHNPLVFIHGSGDNATIWRLQQEHLADQAVYAVDLPGHGARPDTLPPEVTVLDYAREVHTIVQNELHLEKPIIAGHSLGGAIALTMELEYGSELGGLILIGTGARLRVHPSLLESAQTQSEQARIRLVEMGVARPHVGQELQQEEVLPGRNLLYRDLSACNIFDCMARLHEIHLPTLIICGENDRLTPVKYSQYLHQHIANSTLSIIADAGHYVMREQPEKVSQAIEEWLKAH